jgi:hypothetical protein
MNQYATIEEAVFSVGPPEQYNEDFRKPELESRESPELVVADNGGIKRVLLRVW